jgi:NTP pyrophosphatase (non-canonical NTP hydrolase)
MNINELVLKVHQNAKDHGWWDKPRSMAELLCLIHSEVSEALEEDRNCHKPGETYYSGKSELYMQMGSMAYSTLLANTPRFDFDQTGEKISITKPEGIPSELADIVIRVMDICGHYGIDLDAAIAEKMEYNRTRPMCHGGKKL